MGELWRQRCLCDVNLLVEDSEGRLKVSIPAHKVALAACVPYFRAMFTSAMQESSKDEVRLKDVDEVGLKHTMVSEMDPGLHVGQKARSVAFNHDERYLWNS